MSIGIVGTKDTGQNLFILIVRSADQTLERTSIILLKQ